MASSSTIAARNTTSPATDGSAYSSTFAHTNEQASPGYYEVRLDSGVKVELTSTARTGFGAFTYPASTAATMLINVAGSTRANSDASVQLLGNDEVVGSASSGGFCGYPSPYTVYFAAQFNQPFSSWGTWHGETVAQRTERI